jgi:tetratricopeptide (TPR) repeat protein
MSHLQSVIRIASGLKGQEELTLALEMAEYGRKLPRDFQNADRPPFEDFYNDYRIFLQALAGIGVDGAVRYFGAKAERAGPDEDGKHFPAEILVYLLYRVGRYREAIEAHRKFLRNSPRPLAAAPSLFDLCELQGDFTPLLEAARERGDLVEFTAGLVKKHAAAGGAD